MRPKPHVIGNLFFTLLFLCLHFYWTSKIFQDKIPRPFFQLPIKSKEQLKCTGTCVDKALMIIILVRYKY